MNRIKKAFTDVTNSLSRDNRIAQESKSFLNQEDDDGNAVLQRGQEVLYKVKRNSDELKDYTFNNVSKHIQQAKEATGNLYEHAKETTSNLVEIVKTAAFESVDKIKESTANCEEKVKNALINHSDQVKNTTSSVCDEVKEKMRETSESNEAKIHEVKSAVSKKVKEVHELSTSFNQYISEKMFDFKDTVLHDDQSNDDNVSVSTALLQQDDADSIEQDDDVSIEQEIWEKASNVGEVPLDKSEANLVGKASNIEEVSLDKSEANLAEKASEEAPKSELDLFTDRLICDEKNDELKLSVSTPTI